MSEELIYWIVTLSFLLIVGVLMLWHLNSCPHTWKKIESGTVHSKQYHLEDWRQTGYYTIHECVHCKKLKRTRI